MYKSAGQFIQRSVALRKESVDRNTWRFVSRDGFGVSLSARRAWIEMVSLSQEDRQGSRSPQGERG